VLAAKNENVSYIAFVETMTVGTWMEQVEWTFKVSEDEHTCFAAILHGPFLKLWIGAGIGDDGVFRRLRGQFSLILLLNEDTPDHTVFFEEFFGYIICKLKNEFALFKEHSTCLGTWSVHKLH
jgi:hypothetical protein